MAIQKPPQQVSYTMLTLAIVIGVFLGNLGYDLFKASSAFDMLDALVSPQYSAEPARGNQRIAQGNRSAYEQAMQTCEFWKAEFRQEASSHNRTMMTTACAKVRALE